MPATSTNSSTGTRAQSSGAAVKPPSECPTTTRSVRPCDGVDHGVGVVPQSGRLVLARQVDGHRVVAPLSQLASQQVPAPGAVSPAVNQGIGGHSSPFSVVTGASI